METFFWVMTIFVVVLQFLNMYYYGKGNLPLSYRYSTFVFIGFIITESALAFNDPTQRAVILFTLINLWGLYNSAKGWYVTKTP